MVVSADDMLRINNPTDGTVWKTGVLNFVGWTGNCASMGGDSKMVKVDLVNGPSTAVRYVATLGTLDCSNANIRADMTVPSTVVSGEYSIVVRTTPQQSYTNSFQIDNPSQPAGSPPVTGRSGAGAGTGSTSPTDSAASSTTRMTLSTGAMMVLAAFGFQFL
ncbi:hypothetical protein BGZ65_004720 [Modicella reniformis]|uniref:Uncharacterized protein n=1 Tax=Modicella reniformis TaxID=1440133 RepID=A0A9P6LY55_9FUNG|nr:hypothetical protein BGZ65_004720 [Modicella reniformis]